MTRIAVIPTLKDISQAAGTSVSTASLILNGKQSHRFADETVRRVLAKAQQMGYSPQRAAQSLVTGKTQNIALMVNDLGNPFFGRYASIIQKQLIGHGYTVVPFETVSEHPERKLGWLDWISQRAVDAVIDLQSPSSQEVGDAYKRFANIHPVVLRVSEETEYVNELDRILVDYGIGVRQLIQHLAEEGWRRIGFVTVKGHLPFAKDSSDSRQSHHLLTEAFLNALAEQGIETPHDYWRGVEDEGAESADWYDSTLNLLRSNPEINALVVHNIDVVPAVLQAVTKMGRSVGQDLALATFDELPISRWLGPGITVVSEPYEQVATHLVDMVLDRIKKPSRSVEKICVNTELITRASTSFPSPS